MYASCRRSAPLLFFALLCGPGVVVRHAVAAPNDSIAPSVAPLFVDEVKVVEGVVTAATPEGNTVRLQLGTPPQSLRVALVIGLLSNFPPEPEQYYAGKTVRVAGMLRRFRGAVEMVVRDVSDIQVVDARPLEHGGTHAADADEPRLEEMRQKVRTLEERVRQLEQTAPRTEEH